MLEGRVLKLDQLEYVVAAWDGVNRSGYAPLDDKVLVLVDAHVTRTSGGIEIPDSISERQSLAAEHGTVIAVGPAAFRWNDDATRAWEGERPEPGARVYIERYSGQVLRGVDGLTYRLLSQKCVGAIEIGIQGASAPAKDSSTLGRTGPSRPKSRQ